MISILIVDDEVKIVSSLEKLMHRLPVPSIQVFKATSAHEAMDILQTEKIHIVLSDIRMPGMSGLEMHQEIVKRWPLCKVIFLTGYSDFGYIQSALRNGAVDYLMKTEDNETILAAVMKAVESITLNDRKEEIIRKGQEDLRRALPILQKELIADILGKRISVSTLTQDKLDELRLPCRLDEPVVPCFGKIDEWPESFSAGDRQLMNFAIMNIAEEIFGDGVRVISYSEDAGKWYWILQPSRKEQDRFLGEQVQPALEAIQEACRQMLHLKVSFAIALERVAWEQLPSRAERLRTSLYSGIGIDESLLILMPDAADEARIEQEEELLASMRKLSVLTTSLEEGERERFFEYYDHLSARILSLPAHLSKYKIEVYYSLGLIFVSYLNKSQIRSRIEERIDLTRLYTIGLQGTDREVLDYYRRLAEVIFEINLCGQQERSSIIVDQVNSYINRNLMHDLSLNIIGHAIGYNPSYLSRIYKHLTGMGIAEYILNQRLALAKTLLKDTDMKIYEIAARSGFISEGHFFRIFKKTTGMTPTEYRELHAVK
jgi:two-component system response regulator YesN